MYLYSKLFLDIMTDGLAQCHDIATSGTTQVDQHQRLTVVDTSLA